MATSWKIIFLITVSLSGVIGLERCSNDEDLTNGCSIPLGISFPYKDFFLPACIRHDICYTCGNKYGWTRPDCDQGFGKNMRYLCYLKEKSKEKISTKAYTWSDWADFWKELKGSLLVGKGMLKWLGLRTGSLEHCLNGADIYLNAVTHFSMKHFKLQPINQCNWACAEILANPKRGLNITDDVKL